MKLNKLIKFPDPENKKKFVIFKNGFLNKKKILEYNENLEATFKLSPKAVEDIKDKGIWLVDGKDE